MRTVWDLIREFTAESFNLELLYGPQGLAARATILSAITGDYVPKSKAGWNAFRSAVYAWANVTGDCEATRQSNFTAWAKGQQS